MKNVILGNLGLNFPPLARLGPVLVLFFTILDHFLINLDEHFVFFRSKQGKERKRKRRKNIKKEKETDKPNIIHDDSKGCAGVAGSRDNSKWCAGAAIFQRLCSFSLVPLALLAGASALRRLFGSGLPLQVREEGVSREEKTSHATALLSIKNACKKRYPERRQNKYKCLQNGAQNAPE